MAETISKPAGEIYETTDQMMCEVLLMAGHTAVSVVPGYDGKLIYSFSVPEVWDTVESILTGKADTMQFNYSNWWKARVTWQMNLRHLSQIHRS